jgi:dihydrofolate reductase
MKVTLFMAMSLNGVIAGEDGSEDFLSEENWWESFLGLLNKTACVVWGRKTQEVVSLWEPKYHESIKDILKVVVSKSEVDLPEGYILAKTPRNALDILEEKGFHEVLLSGGSTLNSAFIKEGLIDGVILNIEPVLIGKGIPLFNPDDFEVKLEHLDTKKVNEGILQLRYRVVK